MDLIATPRAHNLANTSAPAPGPVAQIAPASAPRSAQIQPTKAPGSRLKSAPKSPALGHSTKKPVSRSSVPTKPGKLHVVKTRERGKECWTVKTGKRGEKKPEFRIRLTDSGYRAMIRFHNDAGKRPERYCCYLSVGEWKEAKRQSLADFARMIVSKVEARRAAGDLDAARYQEIAPRLAALM